MWLLVGLSRTDLAVSMASSLRLLAYKPLAAFTCTGLPLHLIYRFIRYQLQDDTGSCSTAAVGSRGASRLPRLAAVPVVVRLQARALLQQPQPQLQHWRLQGRPRLLGGHLHDLRQRRQARV
eukprot:jgi/Ulvmu1/12529/UM090_0016.1